MKFLIMICFGVFLLVVLFQTSSQNAIAFVVPEHPSVTVDIPGLGAVLGNFDTTLWTNQTFMQFRGIPFAESPKGKLRFKAPVARMPWRQIFDATHYGRRCPVITSVLELSEEELAQDLEDCLNLCVYTKNLTAKQPVMFYIYGGGFYNGSASDHPPKHLLEKDVVLVVPHYRVGALGWLSTRTEDMPGNVPIMDISLALQWVQDHIAEFGGDPQNVTIFAQSGGTAVAGALLLSPKIQHAPFKRAIIQSGSILSSWAFNKNPQAQVERICQALACDACSTQAQLNKCFSEVTVTRLLQVTTDETFSPIEADFYGMLPQNPAELLKSYNRSIPVMTGFTKHDGSFVLATYYDAMKKMVGNLSYVSVRRFAEGLMDMTYDTTGLTNNLLTRLLFTLDVLDSNQHKEALPAYFDLTNVVFMKSPVISFAKALLQKGLADTYVYSFEYAGEHTRFGYEFGNEHYPFNGGVHHSNDNIYLFSTHTLNEVDTEMAKKMVDLWTSFAISGVPTTNGGPEILPMKTESGPYFRINKDISISNDVLQELTSTIDDPNKSELDRKDIEF